LCLERSERNGHNNEQAGLKDRIPETSNRVEQLKGSIADVSRFIEKAKQYTEILELTGEILRVFIKRTEIGKRGERYSRTAEQKISIHYRDIGLFGAFEIEESADANRIVA